MPPLAFSLALAAAVLHAFWNTLLARARDPESATAVALIAAVVVFAPVTALRFDAEWAVWPFIAATSMLQLLYFALLATAYRKAELSFVYPVARGVAPAIVLVVSVVALGQATSPAQVVGVALVGVGVLLVRGLRPPSDPHALAFALGIAGVIASYTLLDKRGITHASPITYLELSMIPAALGYAGATLAVKGRTRVRAELGPAAILAGVASFAAYALVLAALERAQDERVSRSRMVGSAVVVSGIALLALR
jgi:multidrug transporter EmrE-like cation transporter